MNEITYVAIERPQGKILDRAGADRYKAFAVVYYGKRNVATLYPPMSGEDEIGVVFVTREPDFTDILNPVRCEAVNFSVRPDFLTDTLNGLCGMLPPF